MLQRGSMIKIIDYYGDKKQRPKVGDRGYLANMFLYPEKRFILADGVFFRYGCDNSSTKRFEHKRFIIDVGMDTALKYRIVKLGVDRKFFIENFYVNLTPVGFKTVANRNPFRKKFKGARTKAPLFELSGPVYSCLTWNNSTYPTLVGSYGIWKSPYNRNGDIPLKFKVKLPCVALRVINTRKMLSERSSIAELRAWIMASITPIVIYICNTYAHGLDGWFNKVLTIYNNLISFTTKQPHNNFDGSQIIDVGFDVHRYIDEFHLKKFIKNARKVEVMHNMFLSKLYSIHVKSIKNGLGAEFRNDLQTIALEYKNPQYFWARCKEEKTMSLFLHNFQILEFIANIYFRMQINSISTSTDIKLLSKAGFIEDSDEVIMRIEKNKKQFSTNTKLLSAIFDL